MLDLISSDKYCLVNATEKCTGGPFTWYDPAAPEYDAQNSVLDLCIVSQDLYKYVESLKIDNKMEFTPHRPVSNHKKVYTDHYAMRLVLEGIPLVSRKQRTARKASQ